MPIDLAMPVLVVDDSVTTTRIIESYLQQIGFQSVMAVGDGEAALRAIIDRPIALVISDWKMAGMSGLELLHRTRRRPACQGVRFVLMTADANPRLAATVRSMGADEFLTKPFTTETSDWRSSRHWHHDDRRLPESDALQADACGRCPAGRPIGTTRKQAGAGRPVADRHMMCGFLKDSTSRFRQVQPLGMPEAMPSTWAGDIRASP